MNATIKQPFFSIVIPTKGRPDLLRDAIASVLHQDFGDYEVIVSDNFNDNRTRESFELFAGDPRIRYVRTEAELSMPNHWEFATTRAIGKYVLVLTDRSVLKQHALAAIQKVLVEHPDIAICSWRWTLFDENVGVEFGEEVDKRMKVVEILQSEFVAQDFIDKSVPYPYSLPRGLNSCYRADLAARIREKHGALFMPISPDYSSAFLLLAYAQRMLFINKSLFLSQGLKVSNGGSSVSSNSATAYIDTLDLADPYRYTPIKYPFVENCNTSDLIMVKKLTATGLANVQIDWVACFIGCYQEILAKAGNPQVTKPQITHLFSFLETALSNIDAGDQTKVRRQSRRVKLLIWLKRSPLGPALVSLKRNLASRNISGPNIRHQSLPAAAGFKHLSRWH